MSLKALVRGSRAKKSTGSGEEPSTQLSEADADNSNTASVESAEHGALTSSAAESTEQATRVSDEQRLQELLGSSQPAGPTKADVFLGLADAEGKAATREFLDAGSVETLTPAANAGSGSAKKKWERKKLSFDEARHRAQQQVATNARIAKNWMPNQRGAVAALDTVLRTVELERWFKRSFLRHARMIGAIRRLPRSYAGMAAVSQVEASIIEHINKTLKWTRNAIERNNVAIASLPSDGPTIVFQNPYRVNIRIGTRGAIALHSLFVLMDEYMQGVERLYFSGAIMEDKRSELKAEAFRKVFGVSNSVEGFYKRIAARVSNMPDFPMDTEAGDGLATAVAEKVALDSGDGTGGEGVPMTQASSMEAEGLATAA